LKYAAELAKEFPDQLFVIDHIAKPDIKNKKITGWKEDIQNIAAAENVYCKISGMVTEANLENWKKDEFNPYIDAVVEAFGTNRIMYGSDWPVCLLAAPYGSVLDIVKEYFSSFSKNEQDNFFGKNACTFYNLN
jgi:L-fuconolactonase